VRPPSVRPLRSRPVGRRPPLPPCTCAVVGPTLAGLTAATPEHVGVELPRLAIEQSHQLLDVLAGMGLPVEGDYSGVGADGLQISHVVQKTFLAVDEDGTEAAAATAVAVGVSGEAAPTRPVTFDRPFLLVLTDTGTRSPPFVAVVNDPAS
jgi:serpin B